MSPMMTQHAVDVDRSPEVRHSVAWAEHFRHNADRQIEIPWDDAIVLSRKERETLIPSLQDFQLGESSEGRHGLARAGNYGERVGDGHYVEAIRLFFLEENRHAAFLARYLEIQGAPTISHSWTDFVFRRVRRLLGLETLLTVLLSVELIAEVYYRAIRAATQCHALRAICTQILRDEKRHVQFHVERFAVMRRGRWRVQSKLHLTFWRCFFAGTCLAAWIKHRHAFRLGGYAFSKYWSEAWRGFRRATAV